jgi:hypothetical protein
MNSYKSSEREEMLRTFPCCTSEMQVLELMAAQHAKGLLIHDASLCNESRGTAFYTVGLQWPGYSLTVQVITRRPNRQNEIRKTLHTVICTACNILK